MIHIRQFIGAIFLRSGCGEGDSENLLLHQARLQQNSRSWLREFCLFVLKDGNGFNVILPATVCGVSRDK